MVAGSLAEAGPGTEWRSKPAYSNSLAYQPSLLQMTAKTDAERRQMTGAENARYAKLEIDKQIAETNSADPCDSGGRALRRKVQDEQWQHQAKLKQTASPAWRPAREPDLPFHRSGNGRSLTRHRLRVR